MDSVDFEKIRTEAVEKVTKNFSDDSYGNLLRQFAELASQVTSEMLTAYHQSLRGDS